MKQAALSPQDEAKVHFLSVADQDRWAASASTAGSKLGDFLRAIPYRHFARKNIGYLYAIQHGAKFVFDFDDDNILEQDISNVVASPVANETHLEEARTIVVGPTVFNHHPLMGASVKGSWARGLPLEAIQNLATQGEAIYEQPLSMNRIGVLQYCAQGNPDIDAIHRLIKPLPMEFTKPQLGGKPLVVPTHAFAPYNAQATVHTHSALFATLLPITVPGRVSDIWRGYFAKTLFRDLDLAVAFLPPKVLQDRNEHSYLADMKAELDLYFKSGKLIEFLDGWVFRSPGNAHSVPERMEALWIDLYECGYIEKEDVNLVQLWLGALKESGYTFPLIRRHRYPNTVLMGQFNFPSSKTQVLFWVQKWREAFYHVQVRGNFDERSIADFRSAGIDAYVGSPFLGNNTRVAGYYDPMRNLARALQQYKDHEEIDGVLYIHDDAFLNITALAGDNVLFPSGEIIATPSRRYAFQDVRSIQKMNDPRSIGNAFVILKDGTFAGTNGVRLPTADDLIATLSAWDHWNKAIEPLQHVARDERSRRYKESDGSFLVPQRSQSDFMFVPTKLADDFAQAAELMMDHSVFLEIGLPTIIQMLYKVSNTTHVRGIKLCSSFEKGIRGTWDMIEKCAKNKANNPIGMVHPYKLFTRGFREWGDKFDSVTFGLKKPTRLS